MSLKNKSKVSSLSVALSALLWCPVQAETFIECHYETGVFANIMPYGVQAELSHSEDFQLRFVVEKEASVAMLVANNGAAEVSPVWGENKVTFIETTPNGTVHTTTVFGTSPGQKASVHSRSTGGEGFEMPSQYYGWCDVARETGK